MEKRMREVMCLNLQSLECGNRMSQRREGAKAYGVVTRGIMTPPVIVSTRRMNGMMDRTLW